MEPISIFSVILQLSNFSPQFDNFLQIDKEKNITRTELIEAYRANINSLQYQNKKQNQ